MPWQPRGLVAPRVDARQHARRRAAQVEAVRHIPHVACEHAHRRVEEAVRRLGQPQRGVQQCRLVGLAQQLNVRVGEEGGLAYLPNEREFGAWWEDWD